MEPREEHRQLDADSLRDSGFAVREVESTDDGLAAAQGVDLVITAIRMPGALTSVMGDDPCGEQFR